MSKRVDSSRRLVVAAVGFERIRQLAVMLGMVTMPAAARVLELDTDIDFGYSALLLARAARGGSVVSVHEAPRLTQRVHQIHQQWSPERAERLTFRSGPLAAGWAPEAPYDLIVSHSEFGWLPGAWLAQCTAAARVVMPLDTGADGPRLFLRVVVDDQRQPTEPMVLTELDTHPHHTRYEAASDVVLHWEDGGYAITTKI